MESNIKLFDKGLEEYPWSVVIVENMALALWILVGTLISSEFNIIVGWSYLGFALLMIVVILRKMVCTRCYYYGKRCHVGWGYISKILFKKCDTEEFKSCLGIKVAPIVYGTLALIPVILGIITLINKFTMSLLILFLLMISFVIYSSVIARKNSCSKCKMKLLCPGSAAK